MRTLVFATAWADSAEALDLRLGRWARHHAALPWPFEVVLGAALDGVPPELTQGLDLVLVHHQPHLGRVAHLAYPGWWRSFTSGLAMAAAVGAQRILHVESDFFLASPRMLESVAEADRGWVTYWCPRHGFPETGIQVINEECFPLLEGIRRRLEQSAYSCYNGRHAEHVLPFDRVERSLVGDRYGEAGIDPRTVPGLDYYGQLGGEFEPYFATGGGLA